MKINFTGGLVKMSPTLYIDSDDIKQVEKVDNSTIVTWFRYENHKKYGMEFMTAMPVLKTDTFNGDKFEIIAENVSFAKGFDHKIPDFSTYA